MKSYFLQATMLDGIEIINLALSPGESKISSWQVISELKPSKSASFLIITIISSSRLLVCYMYVISRI